MPIHGQREFQKTSFQLPEIFLSNLRLLGRGESLSGLVVRQGIVEIVPQSQLDLVGAQLPHPHRQGCINFEVEAGQRGRLLDILQGEQPRKHDFLLRTLRSTAVGNGQRCQGHFPVPFERHWLGQTDVERIRGVVEKFWGHVTQKHRAIHDDDDERVTANDS